MDTKEDNKDVQLLKDEMWSRKSTSKIQVFDGKKRVDKSNIIKKIRKNNTREKKLFKQYREKMD